MADISRFFLVENGLSLDDEVVIFSGFSDPSAGSGEAAPTGSLLIRTNGELYQKFAAADTDWQLVSGQGASVKVTSSDTTSGFLNDKLTVTSDLLKTVIPNFPGDQALQLDLSPTGVAAGVYTRVGVDAKGRVLSASNPTTLLGYGIIDAQLLHPNLTALSNANANAPPVGIYTITGSGASRNVTITGLANQILVGDGDGVSANPLISIAPNAVLPGTAGFVVPTGTSAQELASANGTIRFNSDTGKFRFRQGGQWIDFGSDLLLYEENAVSPAAPTVTGQNAVAVGEGGVASGQNSVALGTSTAAGAQSTSIGNGSRAASYGQVAFAARPYSSLGSSQGAEYMFCGQTIAQFPIEMYLDGTAQRVQFPDPNTAVTFSALVVAQRVDVQGELFSCKIDGQFFRGATASASVLTRVKSLFGLSYQDMDAEISADPVNGTFNVIVKGRAGQTWRWVVRISTVECIL